MYYASHQRVHIKSNAKNATPQTTAYVSRKIISQLIYESLEKVKGITQEQYNEALKKYPVLGKLYQRKGIWRQIYGKQSN